MTESFYKFPKQWLFEEPYRTLDSDSKLLYMLLCNMSALSEQNQWIDEEGIPFLQLSVRKMAERLNLSQPTIIKRKDELARCRLVAIQKMGNGSPDRIYLLDPTGQTAKQHLALKGVERSKNDEKALKKCKKSAKKTTGNRSKNDEKPLNSVERNKTINKTNNKTINKTSHQDYQETLVTYQDVIAAYQETFGYGVVTDVVVQRLVEEVKRYGKELVLFALSRSREQRARSFRYTQTILKNWYLEGKHTVEQVQSSGNGAHQGATNVPEWSKKEYIERPLTPEEQLEIERLKKSMIGGKNERQ